MLSDPLQLTEIKNRTLALVLYNTHCRYIYSGNSTFTSVHNLHCKSRNFADVLFFSPIFATYMSKHKIKTTAKKSLGVGSTSGCLHRQTLIWWNVGRQESKLFEWQNFLHLQYVSTGHGLYILTETAHVASGMHYAIMVHLVVPIKVSRFKLDLQ